MTKITVKDYFMELRTLAERADRADLVAFVDSRIKQVEAKNSKRSTKPAKNAAENAELGALILSRIAQDEAYTISELQALIPELKDFSNQRVTSIVGALKDSGKLNRNVIKGKAYFSVA